MMNHEHQKTPVCRKFERELYHLQAGELPEDEQRTLREHASACGPCARLLEVEDSLLRSLKRRLVRAEAAPDLRVRVREALEQQALPGRFTSWLRAPWLVPAAAALVLALLLIPTLPPAMTGVVQVEREVTVVDIDCASAGRTVEQQRHCTHPHHLNALQVGPEQYWNISLDREAGRRLVADREMRGHRLRVVGDLYTGIKTLHLTSFIDQDTALEASSGAIPANGVAQLLTGL